MTIFNALAARIVVGITGTLVGAIICFGAAVSPLQAHDHAAVSANPVQTVTVPYTDLDLTSPAGRAKLVRRINMAAHDVCNVERYARSIDTYTAQRECIRHAIATATLPVSTQIAIATSGR